MKDLECILLFVSKVNLYQISRYVTRFMAYYRRSSVSESIYITSSNLRKSQLSSKLKNYRVVLGRSETVGIDFSFLYLTTHTDNSCIYRLPMHHA